MAEATQIDQRAQRAHDRRLRMVAPAALLLVR